MREFLSSKIHKATVTESDLEYIGSITIDENLRRCMQESAGDLIFT
jgi:aspartate 1-decarboxylase